MKLKKWTSIAVLVLVGLFTVSSVGVARKKASADEEGSTKTSKVHKKAKKAKEDTEEKVEHAKKKSHRKAKKEADEAKTNLEDQKKDVDEKADKVEKKTRRRAKKAAEEAMPATEAAQTPPAQVSHPETTPPAAEPVSEPASKSKKSSWMDLLGGGKKKTESRASSGSHRVDGKLDLNTATQEELEAIPGIGPVTAQKIIEHRPYARKDELKVKGIVSEDAYEKMREEIIAHNGN